MNTEQKRAVLEVMGCRFEELPRGAPCKIYGFYGVSGQLLANGVSLAMLIDRAYKAYMGEE